MQACEHTREANKPLSEVINNSCITSPESAESFVVIDLHTREANKPLSEVINNSCINSPESAESFVVIDLTESSDDESVMKCCATNSEVITGNRHEVIGNIELITSHKEDIASSTEKVTDNIKDTTVNRIDLTDNTMDTTANAEDQTVNIIDTGAINKEDLTNNTICDNNTDDITVNTNTENLTDNTNDMIEDVEFMTCITVDVDITNNVVDAPSHMEVTDNAILAAELQPHRSRGLGLAISRDSQTGQFKGNNPQIIFKKKDRSRVTVDGTENVEHDTDCMKILSLTNKKGVRNRNKFECNYCSELVFEYARHLTTMHSAEIEVAAILAKPKGKRNDNFEKLRNVGNFKHNAEVLLSGKGMLIVRRRSNRIRPPNEYLPCTHCFAFFVIDELWRHVRTCKFRSSPEEATSDDRTENQKRQKVLVGARLLVEGAGNKSWEDLDKNYINDIIVPMKRDVITSIVKVDNIILYWGSRLYIKLGPVRARDIRQRLRQLARLVIAVRRNDNCETISLWQCLCGMHFDKVVCATEVLCAAGIDEGGSSTFGKPSIGLKLGHSLYRCAELKRGKGCRCSDKHVIDEAKEFIDLHGAEWTDTIYSRALRTLKTKSMNKPKTLPVLKTS